MIEAPGVMVVHILELPNPETIRIGEGEEAFGNGFEVLEDFKHGVVRDFLIICYTGTCQQGPWKRSGGYIPTAVAELSFEVCWLRSLLGKVTVKLNFVS